MYGDYQAGSAHAEGVQPPPPKNQSPRAPSLTIFAQRPPPPQQRQTYKAEKENLPLPKIPTRSLRLKKRLLPPPLFLLYISISLWGGGGGVGGGGGRAVGYLKQIEFWATVVRGFWVGGGHVTVHFLNVVHLCDVPPRPPLYEAWGSPPPPS